MKYKTIGILGGMGPLATYDLGKEIVANTKASSDQEHIPVLIDCNTRIPDRTDAILHGGEDPLPEMVKSAKLLEAAGADFLIIPCNTAHYYYDGVCREINIPILHMPKETANVLTAKGIKRAGVLATDGTCESGIYSKALEDAGIEALYPSKENQRILMSLIYDYIKAGNYNLSQSGIEDVVREMQQKGAEALILACTELPIAFDIIGKCDLPLVDPTEVLARAAVTAAGGTLSDWTAF